MKVFKFGGATVKDAIAMQQVVEILNKFSTDNLVVIVSAMDKMTNALEGLIDAYFNGKENLQHQFEAIKKYHLIIAQDLFSKNDHPVFGEVERLISDWENYNSAPSGLNYDFEYDQIVCYGELLSTTIVSHYLKDAGIANTWFDARELIRTDATHREAKVDWAVTSGKISQSLKPFFTSQADGQKIALTQGFIGQSPQYNPTSLGREGSDFTAAIFAYILEPDEVIVWKDVAGVFNADPHANNHAVKLDAISYNEAIDMSYYGAKVIHPKTLKPLQNKNIPLLVKPFYFPDEKGTTIKQSATDPEMPSLIVKNEQILIEITTTDFSFITTDHLHQIFGLLAKYNIPLNVMQQAASGVNICVDHSEHLNSLIMDLEKSYSVKYTEDLRLITIRRYDENLISRETQGAEVLLVQKSHNVAQMVVRGEG